MMLKANNEYLEFNADIELERQVKVFSNLSENAGDFSYQFEIELTSTNIRILGNPMPDNFRKAVYQRISAEMVGDNGVTIHYGYIRIEGINGIYVSVSFFSGNNNWFGLLTGQLSDVDFSDFDIELTKDNIYDSWHNDSGLVFPLVDNGYLVSRRSRNLKVEDFVPHAYVHTVIKRIFQSHSIKIKGQLFDDINYRRLTVTGTPDDELGSRSSYAGKLTPQVANYPPVQVTFDDDSNSPFFDGSSDNFKLPFSIYEADVKMRVKVEISVTFNIVEVVLIAYITAYVLYNGADAGSVTRSITSSDDNLTLTLTTDMSLNAGDQVGVAAAVTAVSAEDQYVDSATIRVTPYFVYSKSVQTVLPKWTQIDFVSEVFSLFNVITKYDSVSRELTVDLFDKLKTKSAKDISNFISYSSTDYASFISDYGKRSFIKYSAIEFDDWNANGISMIFQYGDGFITVNNDFIEDTSDILESGFTSPHTYMNGVFDMSMERLDILELEDVNGTNSTSVSDVDGTARFAVEDDIFSVGDLVRISDSQISFYNGDWVVRVVGAGYIELDDLGYIGDTTSKIDRMKTVYKGNDDYYLMFNVPFYSVDKLSSVNKFQLEDTSYYDVGFGYFNMMYTGRQVNEDFDQALSFGEVNSRLFYQQTMMDTYWELTSKVLNDPVMQIVICNLPQVDYEEIDFLSPIEVRTQESSNLYYPNRITGYKGKEFDCTIELIKLP